MDIYYTLEDFYSTTPCIVTTGTFDGVHLGHQKILHTLLTQAKSRNACSVVVTFDPHPRSLLQPDYAITLLTTTAEKIQLLAQLGIDKVVVVPFTKEFATMPASDYVENVIMKTLHTQALVIGYDHAFGKDREGNLNYMQKKSADYGFEIIEIPAEDIDNITISSTKIRKSIAQGDVEAASSYLGRQYSITGVVVHGKKIGRTIGFPTANIHVQDTQKAIPSNGVYAVQIKIDNQLYAGMMNIGTRPTIDIVGSTQSLEVHILHFNQDIYTKTVEIFFVHYLRAEIKFSSLEELTKQLDIDKSKVQKLLKV